MGRIHAVVFLSMAILCSRRICTWHFTQDCICFCVFWSNVHPPNTSTLAWTSRLY